MRCTTSLGLLAAVVIAVPAVGQSWNSDDRLGSDSSSADRLDARGGMNPIRALLLKPVESVAWDGNALGDIVEWLKTESEGKVNIVVQEKALAVESIDMDTEVTLEMHNTTVAEVLNEVLDSISDIDPLTYVGSGTKLKISTKSDFDKKLFTRTYDISDVLVKIKNNRGSPQIDLQQQQQGSGGGGGSNGQARVQSIFSGQGGGGGDEDEDDEGEDEERSTEIMEFIRMTVEPDTWQENNGLGTMNVFNRQLVVRNTLTVHEILGGPFHFDE
ncbi:MAG: hypothetical protein HOP29_11230 [Phycisphaerales bacterium]|nr:hypothetical protein [Phycisphaerales bacterium]